MDPYELASCFNLVIEVLLVSRDLIHLPDVDTGTFQSRNRDAFGFKGIA